MNDTTNLRCELCELPMSCETPPGKGKAIRYWHCARCGRWVASTYGEELVKAHTASEEVSDRFSQRPYDLDPIKQRLSRWLASLDESDPYYVLGVPPSANEETVKSRFKELALQHHPDRGGDPAQMRRFLKAYDQIPQRQAAAAAHPSPGARHRRPGAVRPQALTRFPTAPEPACVVPGLRAGLRAGVSDETRKSEARWLRVVPSLCAGGEAHSDSRQGRQGTKVAKTAGVLATT
ncbi:MAG: J domain-containing protein [Myxococcales bacterium]